MSQVPLSTLAYDHIQQKLLAHELQSGQKVSEHRLAAELGISRTPVREAIQRLKNDGVFVQVSSSGTFVAEPNRRQLVEMYEIRMAVEAMVVAKAIRAIRPREVTQLQKLTDEMLRLARAMRDSGAERMDLAMQKDFLATDSASHQLIAQVADNELAYKIVTDVHLRQCAFGLSSHCRDLRHVAWTWLYHARITSAIRRRDAASAQQHLERHIRCSMRDALRVFDARPSPKRSPPYPALGTT